MRTGRRTSVIFASVILAWVAPSAGSSCAGATLFFSQYQDQETISDQRTGPDKFYQIYNPLGTTVNLAEEYSIASCANGCSLADTFEYGYRFAPGATIAAGGTYTLCNAGLEDTAGCDELLKYPRVSYTGNDLLALVYGTDHTRATPHDVVDRIGRFTTERRVPPWTVCGEASRVVAADVLLTRAAGTCCGSGATDGAFALEWPVGTECEWTDRNVGGWVRPWVRDANLNPNPSPNPNDPGCGTLTLTLALVQTPNPNPNPKPQPLP